MIGAVFGNIVGSRFTSENHRSIYFETLTKENIFTNDVVNMFSMLEVFKEYKEKNISDFTDLNFKFKSICLIYLNRGFEVEFLNNILSVNQKLLNSSLSFNLIHLIPLYRYKKKKNIDLNEIKRFLIALKHDFSENDNVFNTFFSLLDVISKKNKEDIKSFCAGINLQLNNIEKFKINQTYSKDYIFSLSIVVSVLLETDSFIDLIHGVVSVGGDTDTLTTLAGALGELFYFKEEDVLHYESQVKPYFKSYDNKILCSMLSLY